MFWIWYNATHGKISFIQRRGGLGAYAGSVWWVGRSTMLVEASPRARRGRKSEGIGRNKSTFLLQNHHMTTCLAEILERVGTYSFYPRKETRKFERPRSHSKSTEVRHSVVWRVVGEYRGSDCRNIFPFTVFFHRVVAFVSSTTCASLSDSKLR